jgi:hypothetical protein
MKQRAHRARAPRRAFILTSSLALACATWSTPGDAREQPIALGQVSTPSERGVQAEQRLRQAIEDGLHTVDFGRAPVRSRFVLSATLVKLESVNRTDTVRTTCVVSLAMHRRSDQTLQAVINGRAIAEDAAAASEASREDALRGAVHSALSRLPEVVRSGDR